MDEQILRQALLELGAVLFSGMRKGRKGWEGTKVSAGCSVSFSRDGVWHELLEGRWEQHCICEYWGWYKEMICTFLGLILPSKALKLGKGGKQFVRCILAATQINWKSKTEKEQRTALAQQSRTDPQMLPLGLPELWVTIRPSSKHTNFCWQSQTEG